MNRKKLIATIFIIMSIVIILIMINKSSEYKNREKAESYLNSIYPNIEFQYLSDTNMLDGIIVVRFDTESLEKEMSVFIRANNIYDNFTELSIEQSQKQIVTEALKDSIGNELFNIIIDSEFENDYDLKKYLKQSEVLKYYIEFNPGRDHDKSMIAEKYSEIGSIVFKTFENINSIVVKNYDNIDEELFFIIERKKLNNNYSKEKIKTYIMDEKIIFRK